MVSLPIFAGFCVVVAFALDVRGISALVLVVLPIMVVSVSTTALSAVLDTKVCLVSMVMEVVCPATDVSEVVFSFTHEPGLQLFQPVFSAAMATTARIVRAAMPRIVFFTYISPQYLLGRSRPCDEAVLGFSGPVA